MGTVDVPNEIGGARRDRTADLNTASVALSELSYGPERESAYFNQGPKKSQAIRQLKSRELHDLFELLRALRNLLYRQLSIWCYYCGDIGKSRLSFSNPR